MKLVSSDALGMAQKTLGLTGAGAQSTEFLDGQLDQTLDVAPIVRRSRTIASSGGIFTATLQNVHAGVSTDTTTWLPYSSAVGARNGFPAPIPDWFDLWILYCGVTQTAGGGTMVAGLYADFASVTQGFGLNDSGVAVATGAVIPLALWDSVLAAPNLIIGLQENGDPLVKLGLRLPRSAMDLRFVTTSSEAATFQCDLVVGVFPIALGQDVIV